MPKGFGRPMNKTLRQAVGHLDKAEDTYAEIKKTPPANIGQDRAKIGKWMDEGLDFRMKQADREKDLLARTAERRKTRPQAFKKGGMVRGRDYGK